MTHKIYQSILTAKEQGEKKIVVLIDPDKFSLRNIKKTLDLAIRARVDYFFIGGSLVVNNMLDYCLQTIKESCDIPMILFPGNSFQLSYKADGILFPGSSGTRGGMGGGTVIRVREYLDLRSVS